LEKVGLGISKFIFSEPIVLEILMPLVLEIPKDNPGIENPLEYGEL
jgi:hypothetical protein